MNQCCDSFLKILSKQGHITQIEYEQIKISTFLQRIPAGKYFFIYTFLCILFILSCRFCMWFNPACYLFCSYVYLLIFLHLCIK